MDAVAKACLELGLPGVPPEVVRVSRSKLLQRQAFGAAGLLTPDFRAVTELEAALSAWDDFQAEACVLKPVDASGSRGVSFVSSRDSVSVAFELARQNSHSGRVMVESFMPGIEYSVEAWVLGSKVHVLATSEKLRTQPPYLLDRQIHFPDSLPPERRRLMVEHAVRAIRACGFRDCPVHLECIDHARGPMIVELAARGAGFKVFTEMLPRVTGLSTARASIEAALGKLATLTFKPEASAASLVFIDPVPGLFKAAHGLEDARALPGVAEAVLYTHPGQKMNLLRSGSDRAGHILVYDQDASRCRTTAQKALDLIRLEVEP
jgi:biotin carboxylase